jgi:hypothetical protein
MKVTTREDLVDVGIMGALAPTSITARSEADRYALKAAWSLIARNYASALVPCILSVAACCRSVVSNTSFLLSLIE